MFKEKHQWVTFHKGRMRIRACSTCGDIHFAGNTESKCQHHNIFESQIVKAGYRLYENNRLAS